MAKHNIGKKVSKGQRRSSIKAGGNPNHPARLRAAGVKPAIIGQQAERVATTMREAFLGMTIKGYDGGKHDVVDAVLTCAKQNSGNNKAGRGWTANLTPQTVRKLVNDGVFA